MKIIDRLEKEVLSEPNALRIEAVMSAGFRA